MNRDRSPIAIVGMAGLFPGAADLAQFWKNIAGGVDSTRDVPPGRWPLDPADAISNQIEPDRVLHARGGYLEPFAANAAGLNIDPALLATLDPLYHLVLRVGREAFESAMMDMVDRDRVGVAQAAIALPTDGASAITREWFGEAVKKQRSAVSNQRSAIEDHSLALHDRNEIRNLKSQISNPLNAQVVGFPAELLASALRLGGGAFTLDAACASSLYAIKLACDELHEGRADAMLAGGVSRPDCLYTQMGFTQLHALSPSGRCRPFDAHGDGLLVGEGAGIFVLKRLPDARRDGDRVLGIIRGIGLSNDIGGSLLAPDNEGQLRAMRAAYEQAGWSPDDVDVIECHGTGTPTGDAAELRSLQTMFGAHAVGGRTWPIGSVKSNIGHLLTAAGAAGLIKILLGMREGLLLPSANYETPAEELSAASALRVQTEPAAWTLREGRPRRAAISAFGFGGINAHVLVESDGAECEINEDFKSQTSDFRLADEATAEVAIVGMAVHVGNLTTLREFQEATLRGKRYSPADLDSASRPHSGFESSAIRNPQSAVRNRASHASASGSGRIESLSMDVGQFKLPPNEIGDVLPQQLLMLQVAADALADAGMPLRERRPRVGTVIGIAQDMAATNFHLRWAMDDIARAAACAPYGASSLEQQQPDEFAAWVDALRLAASPALTPTRTLGALGGIVASRVAREFGFGGPSFVISAQEASGLRALDAATRALQRGEVDAVLVGAVDFASDARLAIDSASAADGAAAVVIKRLADARRDGDRIYAVVRGIGAASGDAAAEHARERAWADSRISPAGFVLQADEAHRAGAATGLISLVRAAVSLFQETLPPYATGWKPVAHNTGWKPAPQNSGHAPSFWARDRAEGPRLADVSAHGADGGAMHVVLAGYERVATDCAIERRQPLGANDEAVFAVSDEEIGGLTARLREFESWLGAMPDEALPIERAARLWFERSRGRGDGKMATSFVAAEIGALRQSVADARRSIEAAPSKRLDGRAGTFYSPEPLAHRGKLAFVFPGSGNEYAGMFARLSAAWPDAMRSLDADTAHFASQLGSITRDATDNPNRAIISQVAWGVAASDVLQRFGVRPSAVIGYSLGETAGLFAMRAWRDRDEMFARLERSTLFRAELGGPCNAARRVWKLADSVPADWFACVVNRSAERVRTGLVGEPRAMLLIVNAPDECVIGGQRAAVLRVVASLGCEAVGLTGVATVHCELVREVEATWRELHLLSTTPPGDVRFYSAAWGRAYDLSRERAAASITDGALNGFDFPAVVNAAYRDGVRLFVEIGPQASCTRMIGRILEGEPHMARSMNVRGEDDVAVMLRLLAALIAERVPVDLATLYGLETRAVGHTVKDEAPFAKRVVVRCGGPLFADLPLPPNSNSLRQEDSQRALQAAVWRDSASPDVGPYTGVAQLCDVTSELSPRVVATAQAEAAAHATFLEFAETATSGLSGGLAVQSRLLALVADLDRDGRNATTKTQLGGEDHSRALHARNEIRTSQSPQLAVFLDRAQCMAFAIGRIGDVLGPEFSPVDSHPTRVRLPDEPLMLVDRIVSVQGEPRSLGAGRVVTEHDVHLGAWYLDGDRAPVCISVEAGQADLFLCAYLGIDFQTRGLRTYRLLDATVTFHRGLPRPGETISYDIAIDKFVRQGDTWLFFFRFDGTIGGQPILTMRDGCAGFFTPAEIDASRGIVLTAEEAAPAAGARTTDYSPFSCDDSAVTESLDEARITALRRGDLAGCFGPRFAGLPLREPVRLPGGRMKLIDRVSELCPAGGRFGLGRVRAEADVHPDDWFLTCHFVDDMVMPGTLMYECCAHALRVLLYRIGWVCEHAEVAFEPVPGVPAQLKCRGPVTQATRTVWYDVEIKEIGYRPEPYVIADALMYADGERIVQFRGMSMQLTGMTRARLEVIWGGGERGEVRGARDEGGNFGYRISDCGLNDDANALARTPDLPPTGHWPLATPFDPKLAIFDRERITAFAVGKPSDAFGAPYRVFDGQRRIARLPGPPFQFLDRITEIYGMTPFVLKAEGWIEAQYDVPPDAWYFAANRQPWMPFSVILEAALQPCGWLAAYLGSALRSEHDLSFRNLGGKATLHENFGPDAGTLTTRVRMTSVSEAGGMIIQNYDFRMYRAGRVVYDGTTSFGFFSAAALAQQVGIRDAAERMWTPAEDAPREAFVLPDVEPFSPDAARCQGQESEIANLRSNATRSHFVLGPACAFPARAYRMVDGIDILLPDGGPKGLGFARGSKRVNADDWFFKAHFFQDPVWPGSLGLESFIQVMKSLAVRRWGEAAEDAVYEPMAVGVPHEWRYRGQIIPKNALVEIDCWVTRVETGPVPLMVADGFLRVDGLNIYEMRDFGLRFAAPR